MHVDEIKNGKYDEIQTCTSKRDSLISRSKYWFLLRLKVKWFLGVEIIKVMTCYQLLLSPVILFIYDTISFSNRQYMAIEAKIAKRNHYYKMKMKVGGWRKVSKSCVDMENQPFLHDLQIFKSKWRWIWSSEGYL